MLPLDFTEMNNMRGRILAVMTMVGLCLAACKPATAYPGTLQDFAVACAGFNKGQQVAVEGYLRLPDTLTSTSSVELRLYRDLGFHGRPIGVPLLFGDAPNEARRITASYRDQDLIVHLADGSTVPFRTKVRVSGRMHIPVAPSDFMCELENPYIEKAK